MMKLEPVMGVNVRLSYFYADSDNWEKFVSACDRLGWAQKSFLQQIAHSYFGKHGSYYANTAVLDAEARGMAESEYYQSLSEGKDLLSYKSQRPDIEPSPLARIPDPETTANNRRRYNVVSISDYYYVLLQVALIVDRCTLIEFFSRVVVWHFSTYWERSYQPQIDHAEKCLFVLED